MTGCGSSTAPNGLSNSAVSSIPTSGYINGQPVTSTIVKTGKYLTDTEGRVIVFHGVNIVRKLAPYYPDTLTSADTAFLADEGFNVARIGWIWAGSEPSPGVYDDTYMQHILDFNALLGQYGIRSFVDFHQDSYSEKAGANGTGGDGAPDWATLESSSGACWQDFWADKAAADGVGIQTRFDALWTHAAQLILNSPNAGNIMGLDPINEPNPGNGYQTCVPAGSCPSFETSDLTNFYKRVITSIRSTGESHTVWVEDEPDHMDFTPAFTTDVFSDPQTAYSWHDYCLPTEVTANPDGAADTYCDMQYSKAASNETTYGDQMKLPELVGEFGANGADESYAKQVDGLDAYFLSWTYWLYYIPTGDPSDPAAGSILTDSTKPGSEANASQPKLDALVVPYPQAVAGTPGTYSFDHGTNVMTMTYSPAAAPGATLAGSALTQIFVPKRHYPTGYTASVTGANVVSAPDAAWVMLRAQSGATQVKVTISPTTGGVTQLPSQTIPFPLASP